jgi:hypothetical protein
MLGPVGGSDAVALDPAVTVSMEKVVDVQLQLCKETSPFASTRFLYFSFLQN